MAWVDHATPQATAWPAENPTLRRDRTGANTYRIGIRCTVQPYCPENREPLQ